MSTLPADAIEHFVAKWHRREPEMALAEVFCAPELRVRFRAWGALVHELREAAFELSDARVTAVKSQWWAEELLNLSQGRGRHPISAELALPALPWAVLARALMEQAQFDARPGDAADALDQVRGFASALAQVEAGVFGETPSPDAAQALAVHLLLQRLPAGLAGEDQARLPLNLMARHGLTAAQVAAGQGEALLRDWARELSAALPAPEGPLFRRLRTRFDRIRVDRLAAGKGFAPPAAPLTVWRAWRVARNR
jgi:phytoene/squalene synthetase